MSKAVCTRRSRPPRKASACATRWIRSSLPANAALDAETYFTQCGTIRDRAAVFLAILELGRARAVECRQNQAFAPLWLCTVPDTGRLPAEIPCN